MVCLVGVMALKGMTKMLVAFVPTLISLRWVLVPPQKISIVVDVALPH